MRMAAEVSRVCGPREADGYLRFVDYARDLWQLERDDFIDRNLDAPTDLLTANLLRLIAAGGLRRLQTKIDQFFRDPRTRRMFSFQSMYAGMAPHDALAIYTVIAYLDSVAGVYFPRGGIHAVSRALADAAEKHGVQFRYGTTVEQVETALRPGHRGDHHRGGADRRRRGGAQPGPAGGVPGPAAGRPGGRKLRYSPSCVVLHIGSKQGYPQIAHHNIHFGRRLEGHLRRGDPPRRADERPVAAGLQPQPQRRHRRPGGPGDLLCARPHPEPGRAALDWRGDLARRVRRRTDAHPGSSAATSGSPTGWRCRGS